jgi:transposase
MGRSRGGLTTKIHALTDARGLPLELVLTPGQAGDCPVAARLLGHLRPDFPFSKPSSRAGGLC